MIELRLRPTDKIVELRSDSGASVPARVWQGETASGIPVHCFVTRVAVDKDRPPHEIAEFEQALSVCEPPRAEIVAYPLRLIL